jgi:hypothetical protein
MPSGIDDFGANPKSLRVPKVVSWQTCDVDILCAECGCRVERGVIVEPCDRYPACCCTGLPVRQAE